MKELNTCPACGSGPVRITPPFMFGQPYYECLNRECRHWSPRYAGSLEPEARPDGAPVLSPTPPEVTYHGDPGDILGGSETPTADRPVFLWTTRHNDFGDV